MYRSLLDGIRLFISMLIGGALGAFSFTPIFGRGHLENTYAMARGAVVGVIVGAIIWKWIAWRRGKKSPTSTT